MRAQPALSWTLLLTALTGASLAPSTARGPAQQSSTLAGPAYQAYGNILTELGGEVKLDRVCVDARALESDEHARLRAFLAELNRVSPLSVNDRNCVLLNTLRSWAGDQIASLRDILIESSGTLRFSLDADAGGARTLSVAKRDSSDGFTIDGIAAASGLPAEDLRDELSALSVDQRLVRPDSFRWGKDFFTPTLVQYSLMMAFNMATQPENRAKLSVKTFGKNFVTAPGNNPWDPFFVQYVAHPYKDSISYQLARDKGANIATSSLASLFGVVLWEYGYEGWYQKADRVDLTVGLAGGILLGEASYRIVKRMCKDGRLSKTETAIALVLNPQRITHLRTCPKYRNH